MSANAIVGAPVDTPARAAAVSRIVSGYLGKNDRVRDVAPGVVEIALRSPASIEVRSSVQTRHDTRLGRITRALGARRYTVQVVSSSSRPILDVVLVRRTTRE